MIDQYDNCIGKKLRELRKWHGVSLREMGEAVGVDPHTVGSWERGMTIPNIIQLKRAVDYLGRSITEFTRVLP